MMMTSVEVNRVQKPKLSILDGEGYAREAHGKEAEQGTIPPRYRDGRGGIDLEQVRRDQRHARQQVVRALLERLKRIMHWG